jgi:pimeloyl-ACP methyl ester carboxylesterase
MSRSHGPIEMPFVEGVRHSYVDVDGLLMHVAEAGQGEPVILLHGWPENWYMWRNVIPELAKRYRVIAPDLRGFGWTEAPRRGYHKEQFATDILGLMDALRLERVRLVGHDWGGWTGFLMCLRQPQRFERYLALNITHPWPPTGPSLRNARRFWYMALMASGLGEILLRISPEAFIRKVKGTAINPRAFSDADLHLYIDSLSTPARAHASAQTYRTLFLRDGPDIARRRYHRTRLTVPTLLLFGTEDVAIGVDMLAGFEAHADDMRLELVPDCGHFIVDEQPELVVDRALSFLGASATMPERKPMPVRDGADLAAATPQ